MKTVNGKLEDNGDGTWAFTYMSESVTLTDEEVKEFTSPPQELSEEELREIAEGIYHGRIFCDRQVHTPQEIPMVFMPLALMDDKGRASMILQDANFVYEYVEKAGPRSINGMPCFFSMRFLTTDQAKKVLDCHHEMVEARKDANETDDASK